jgi:ribosome-associated toxin RatA of RatAB toxin-antitoxin module
MKALLTHLFQGARATELLPIFADVEAYPSVVPGFKSAKVVRRNGSEYQTKAVMALEIGFLAFEEEIESITRQSASCIEVCSTGSRFIKSFRNTWHFRDMPAGCDVAFEMTIEFVALPGIVRSMLGSLAEMQAEEILRAFVARVEAQRCCADLARARLANP